MPEPLTVWMGKEEFGGVPTPTVREAKPPERWRPAEEHGLLRACPQIDFYRRLERFSTGTCTEPDG